MCDILSHCLGIINNIPYPLGKVIKTVLLFVILIYLCTVSLHTYYKINKLKQKNYKEINDPVLIIITINYYNGNINVVLTI